MHSTPGGHFPLWGRLACLGISAVALFLIFRRIDPGQFASVFSRLKLEWLLGANLLYGLATLLAAARWHLLLRMNQGAVHAVATTRMVFIGHLFNTLLFGPAGGDIAKAATYGQWYDRPVPSVLATCYLDRLVGGLGFLLLAAIAPSVAAFSGGFSFASEVLSSPTALSAAAAVVAVMLLGGFLLHRRFGHWSPLRNFIRGLLSGASQLVAQPRCGFYALLFAFVAHVCTNVMLLLCLQAVVPQPLPFLKLLWTSPVISLISSAPVTFAGTGLREGAALVLFGLYGIAPEDAVAASLLALVTYLLWAGIGGWIFVRERKRQRQVQDRPTPRTISVIIPTLNETKALEQTVNCVRPIPEVRELLVVDGGSSDETVALAQRLGCQTLLATGGRGGQLSAGARHASGDVVLLLHADTWLPAHAGVAILDCLRDRTVVGGGFWKVFRERKLLMLGSRFRCGVRLLLGRRVLGDQAMFVRSESLSAIGGVPEMPLMEEFELCRRLRTVGRLALAGATVSTSARRFEKLGVLRTYLRMWQVTLRYYLGTPPQKLERLYKKE